MFQLGFFGLCLAACTLAGGWYCRHALDLIVFGLPNGLPDPKLQRVRDLERAWTKVRWTFAWWCVCMSGVHAYDSVKRECLARRAAARCEPPPFHCGQGSPAWADLSWMQATTFTFFPTSATQSCEEYHLRTMDPCWPNIAIVLVDTFLAAPLRFFDRIADAIQHVAFTFLDHFSFPVKLVIILAFASCLTLLLALCIYLPSLQRFAHVVRREYSALPTPEPRVPPRFQMLEDFGSVADDGCMLTLKEL